VYRLIKVLIVLSLTLISYQERLDNLTIILE
jgi:hypothetical protein